jgi:glycosyltransferase involved in cell wall biosynthesis
MSEPPVTLLTAYPLSRSHRSKVDQVVAAPVRVIVLAELKRARLWQALSALRGVRGDRAYAVTEDANGRALEALLRVALGLTRARQLAIVSPDLRIVPFRRVTILLEVARVIFATLAGMLALVACQLELAWLTRRAPALEAPANLRTLAYLKTTLWLGVQAGGSIGHVAGVVNALARRLQQVHVLSPDPPPLLAPAVRVSLIPPDAASAFPYELNHYRYHRRFARRAWHDLRRSPPDVLYQRLGLANYAGAALARRLRVPLVVEYNGSEAWVARHWGLGLRFPKTAAAAERALLRHASVIVTVSNVLRDELVERGVPEAKIVTHPNGIDPERFDPSAFDVGTIRAVRVACGIDPDAVVCGFIGTFGQWHGVLVLAEAIRRFAEREREWLLRHRVHFLVIGDGLLMPEVRAILEAPETAALATLTGLVPQDQAPRYLAACDVLLSPHVPNADGSRFFGSPTKLFEYMCIERAIVASGLEQIADVLQPAIRPGSAARELEAGTTDAVAVVVTPGDVDELMAGVRLTVERPELRRRIAANARRLALGRYTWAHHVDAILSRVSRSSPSTGRYTDKSSFANR